MNSGQESRTAFGFARLICMMQIGSLGDYSSFEIPLNRLSDNSVIGSI